MLSLAAFWLIWGEDLSNWGAVPAIVNLVSNAVVHGFEERLAGLVRISARELGQEYVELTIEDNGCGMSPEVQARAFEAFYTTKADRGGTGLGLDIVRHIVTSTLGGELNMYSEIGVGTPFTMRLARHC